VVGIGVVDEELVVGNGVVEEELDVRGAVVLREVVVGTTVDDVIGAVVVLGRGEVVASGPEVVVDVCTGAVDEEVNVPQVSLLAQSKTTYWLK